MLLPAQRTRKRNELAKIRYGRPYGNLCPRRQKAISRLAIQEEQKAREKAKDRRRARLERFTEFFSIVFRSR